jgi:membrane-bound metal-dependent hydrolase YbcI (DUF457 family)
LKGITHVVFSVGLGVFISTRLGFVSLLDIAVVAWLALSVNVVIDVFGHGLGFGRNAGARSFVTHSVFTAPFWGGAVAALSLYILVRFATEPMGWLELVFLFAMGLLMAYSHLLLDALTEGGIFWGTRRVALAHMRYNNLVLNSAFLAIGTLLVVATAAALTGYVMP